MNFWVVYTLGLSDIIWLGMLLHVAFGAHMFTITGGFRIVVKFLGDKAGEDSAYVETAK